jgi:hypothetical protein
MPDDHCRYAQALDASAAQDRVVVGRHCEASREAIEGRRRAAIHLRIDAV